MPLVQKDNLGSWDCYTSNFLKAEQVKDEKQAFVVINVESFNQENREVPRLTLESDSEQFTFDMNVTNSTYCKNSGIKSPRMLIGKKLYFKKVEVNNPRTKMLVSSLRIRLIE